MARNQELGNVLEDLVALLLKLPGLEVKVRVRVNVPNEERKREIDVLVTPLLVGEPVPIVIECKNHKNPVDVSLIDGFLGKLEDLEIPAERGVFVSSMGFTSGALSRAKKSGVQLLRMEGLDETRLAKAVNAALLSVVHRVLFVRLVSVFPFLPGVATGEEWPYESEPTADLIYEEVWKRWIIDDLPVTLGEHSLFYRSPVGGFALDYQVYGYVGNVDGESSCLKLSDVSTARVERMRLETKFQIPNSLDIQLIESEETLNQVKATIKQNSVKIIQLVKVPRIVTGVIYWPPSEDAIKRINRLVDAGKNPTFGEVEGDDLGRAWEGPRFQG